MNNSATDQSGQQQRNNNSATTTVEQQINLARYGNQLSATKELIQWQLNANFQRFNWLLFRMNKTIFLI